jgi:hypothetical protein
MADGVGDAGMGGFRFATLRDVLARKAAMLAAP